MKKNILAILILAATLVNLTLTAVSLFVVVPTNSKTNNLIKKIVAMVDIDLENESIKQGANGEPESVPIKDSVPIPIEEELVATLKSAEGETKKRYLQINATVSLNKGASDYKKVNELVAAHLDKIKETIVDTCAGYTVYNVMDSKEQIKQEIIVKLQAIFETQCIYDITFSLFNLGQ